VDFHSSARLQYAVALLHKLSCIVGSEAVMRDGSRHNLTDDKWDIYDSTTLHELKDQKKAAIDIKTGELIQAGFTFDNKIFSMSEPAQINWIAISANETLLSFPLKITTKDDKQYNLQQVDTSAFYGAALAHKQGYLDSGRDLKILVDAAIDKAGVLAVVDDRT